MKKIINGKMYNTETAKLVGEWDNGRYGSDFGRCYEALYKKKTGEFFLYGEGGPMSKYAVSRGNYTCGSESIAPMMENDAKKWAEVHITTDEYESTFGKVDE